MTEVINYRVLTPNDNDKIRKSLIELYSIGEPIIMSTESGVVSETDIQHTIDGLYYNSCFAAYISNPKTNDDEFIGIVLCIIDSKKSSEELHKLYLSDELQREDQKAWKRMVEFYCWVDRTADLFNRYNYEKIHHCIILAVHPSYKRQGIAKKLVGMAIQKAREMKHKLFTIDCSNCITAKIARGYGLTSYNNTPFSEILGSDGQQLYNPAPPHVEYGLYEIELN